MPDDKDLRVHLVQLLEGGHAHATFDQATREFPVEKAGIRPPGSPYSAWELLEHMRIAQNDILRFSQSAEHRSPEWPRGYWPASPAPERPGQWQESLTQFLDDLAEFLAMVRNPASDLYRAFPWGDGQTLLREALLIADHNAYHLGQLVLVRRLLDTWKE
jgi:DinB superfamily